jgi:hypothetical protein
MMSSRWIGLVFVCMSGCPADEEADSSEPEASTGASTGEESQSMSGVSASPTSDGATTGPGDPCAGLAPNACEADAACTVISCQRFQPVDLEGGGYCLTEPDFAGCRSADLSCDDAPTIVCEGGDVAIFLCPDSCTPEAFPICEPPAIDPPPC